MAQTFEQGLAAPPPAWPEQVAFAVPPETDVLPIPAAHNFRYSRVFRMESAERPKVAAKKPAVRTAARPREPAYGGWFGTRPAPTRSSRNVGHQLTVVRPPVNQAPQMR
jgi:hypothetical protein